MDEAIALLEFEISVLQARNNGQGPEETSSEYYVLQAKSLGLSLLRAAKAKGVTVDDLRQKVRKDLNG